MAISYLRIFGIIILNIVLYSVKV